MKKNVYFICFKHLTSSQSTGRFYPNCCRLSPNWSSLNGQHELNIEFCFFFSFSFRFFLRFPRLYLSKWVEHLPPHSQVNSTRSGDNISVRNTMLLVPITHWFFYTTIPNYKKRCAKCNVQSNSNSNKTHYQDLFRYGNERARQ